MKDSKTKCRTTNTCKPQEGVNWVYSINCYTDDETKNFKRVAMNKETLGKIIGYEKVIGLYGEWPSFHDAEVLSLTLDRDSESEFQGPTLIIKIHAFTMTSEVTPKGNYKCINHATLHFELDGVEEIVIEGFNHQNAVFGMSIEEVGDKSWEGDYFKFELDPSYGVGAKMKCRRIKISEVVLGIPRGSVYNG